MAVTFHPPSWKQIKGGIIGHYENILAVGAFLMYAVLILEKLPQFPIYYFCDEAMVGVDAYAILTTGVSSNGERWPVFFRELGFYSHSISVYLNLLPVWLFGLNEFATRLTTALSSFVGVLSVYALLRWVYKQSSGWLVFLVFVVSPLWFLHSRTVEYVMAASFFLAFGLFYILSLKRHWAFVIPCAIFGAATFYAHTTGRGWVGVSLILWFLFNIPENFRHWRRALIGLPLFALLLVPYLQTEMKLPEIASQRLQSMKEYFHLTNLTIGQQIHLFWNNYTQVIHPSFWFTWAGTQNSGSMERHIIPRLPLLLEWAFPFACLGVVVLLIRIKRLENRTILAMFLAAPVSASLIEFNIHRAITVGVMMMVFALIGAGETLRWMQRWPHVRTILVLGLAITLSCYALWFRHYVYTYAPYKYQNYEFYGIQMGQPEVFTWIKEHYTEYDNFLLASNLFNATHIFVPFYLHESGATKKVRVFDTTLIYKTRQSLPEHAAHILPMHFFSQLEKLRAPIAVTDIATIPDKRGVPLFRIVTLERRPEFEAWFTQVEEHRSQPQRHIVKRNNADIIVDFPPIDLGSIPQVFDGNRRSFARTDQINPATITVRIPTAALRTIRVIIPHDAATVTLHTTDTAGQTISWGGASIASPEQYVSVYEFPAPTPAFEVTTLTVIIHVTNADQYGHVHVAELEWE